MIPKTEVTELLQQLVAIKSEYFHEDDIMDFAADWLRRHGLPAQLHQYHDAKVTNFHGKNVFSLLPGSLPGPVICLNGHLDTVQRCGGWTRDPYGELDGDRLYGGGALDMKSGVAGHMYLIQYFAEHPEELDGNLLAIGECDEEDNSKGIITALDLLEELKEKEHFEYVACINADYSTNYAPGDENRYIYYGSIGKLLPLSLIHI